MTSPVGANAFPAENRILTWAKEEIIQKIAIDAILFLAHLSYWALYIFYPLPPVMAIVIMTGAIFVLLPTIELVFNAVIGAIKFGY